MNAPDPRDIRAIERQQHDQLVQEQLAHGQNAADLAWLMSQPQGRRFMARLLDLSGIDRNSFTGNSTTFYNEGARSLGVLLLAEAKVVAWDDYIAMLKEQRK
jgi:hypothetical protein